MLPTAPEAAERGHKEVELTHSTVDQGVHRWHRHDIEVRVEDGRVDVSVIPVVIVCEQKRAEIFSHVSTLSVNKYLSCKFY